MRSSTAQITTACFARWSRTRRAAVVEARSVDAAFQSRAVVVAMVNAAARAMRIVYLLARWLLARARNQAAVRLQHCYAARRDRHGVHQ